MFVWSTLGVMKFKTVALKEDTEATFVYSVMLVINMVKCFLCLHLNLV